MRSSRALLLVALAALACSSASTDLGQPRIPTSLVIPTDSVTAYLGGVTYLPKVTLYDAEHQVMVGEVRWSSGDTTIALVNGSRVIAKAEGATTLTVKSVLGSASGTARLGVTQQPGSIVMTSNISGSYLFAGDSVQAYVWEIEGSHDTLSDPITISALTPAIATITPRGVVHAHAAGVAAFLAAGYLLADTLYLRVFGTRVARLTTSPASLQLVVGHETPLSFHAFDALGNELARPAC